jgi:D-amino-acid oxidase
MQAQLRQAWGRLTNLNLHMSNRRQFLQMSGVLGVGILSGLSTACTSPKFSQKYIDRNFIASNKFRKFPKLEISKDRIVKETVGLRPFRKQGFRLEKQELGSKTIIHNYGHGGSGWSLSWGTARMVVDLAQTTSEKSFAVMGSGVIGITTARLLQENGYQVTIYTKALPPLVTSSKATGTWSPASRLLETQYLTPAFEEQWKKAAMYSFRTYQNLLGFNDIVTWIDNYVVRDTFNADFEPSDSASGSRYARLRIQGLLPERQILDQKQHPFHVEKVVKQTTLVFNIPSYLNKHLTDFISFGGKVVVKDFKSLEDVDALTEKCVINCTGLGSMALFNDNDMMPIAGQLSFLIPQPDFNYRISAENGYAIPRKDGIILGGNALEGNWDETPDAAQTQKVVDALINVMDRLRV